jgi:hypothetical protein
MFNTTWRRSAPRTGAKARPPQLFRPSIESLEERVMLFKPVTHLATGLDVLRDVLDLRGGSVPDGLVTIAGHDYQVNAAVVSALSKFPQFYNAGTIGPDAFPDLVMGQSIIHPKDTGRWLSFLLNQAWKAQSDTSLTTPGLTGAALTAERAQILAFTYGYLTHAAGDLWAHTLVNRFADGTFPNFGDLPKSQTARENAVRHILTEAYIGDATPGFDGNPARGPAPGGDVSDDSTPGVALDAPHYFIFKTLVDPAAGPSSDRGAILNYFIQLRDRLVQIGGQPPQNPLTVLQQNLQQFNNLSAARDDVIRHCSNLSPFDIPALIQCLGSSANLVGDAVLQGYQAVVNVLGNLVDNARDVTFNSYLRLWAADIDDGLQHWSELGLAVGKAVFDPQARRDVQNGLRAVQGLSESNPVRANAEDAVNLTDVLVEETADFVNVHMLSMLGAPDFVGDLRGALQGLGDRLADVLAPVIEPINRTLNPIFQLRDDVKDFAKELVAQQVEDRFLIPLDDLDAVLSRSSSAMDLQSLDLPSGRLATLFQPGDHALLDQYLGITQPNHNNGPEGILGDTVTFNPATFAAYANTVTMGKLLLLDGTQMNKMIGNLTGITDYALYGTDSTPNDGRPATPADGNVMTRTLPVTGSDSSEWLRLIDGDHAWRADAQPLFNTASAGNGNFPLWESVVLRNKVFRVLFKDWENPANAQPNFPDLGDSASHDPNEKPPTVTLVPSFFVPTPANPIPNPPLFLIVQGTTLGDAITIDTEGTNVLRVSWGSTDLYLTGKRTIALSPLNLALLAPQLQIIFNGQNGDDRLELGADVPGFLANLDGGAGSDTYVINLRPGGGRTVTVNDTGTSGTDTLRVNGTSSADAITVTNSVVASNQPVTYAGVEGLTVNGEAGGDTVNVVSCAAATPVTVDGGPDNDTVNVGTAAAGLAGILGNVHIPSTSASDRLNINDQATSTGPSYTVTTTTVFKGTTAITTATIARTGSPSITYNGPQAVVLNAGGGGDTFDVQVNLNSSYNLTVDGSGNKDLLKVTDLSRAPSITNTPSSSTSGTVRVTYVSGVSVIGYVNTEQLTALPNAERSFVQALYQAFLGRSGSREDLEYWSAALHGPGGRAAVIAGIVESAEARTRMVLDWYQTYLGRSAAGGEEQGWVGLLLQGMSEEQALAGILGSPEFFIHSGGTDGGFAQALFARLLGRGAGPVEDAVLRGVLASGMRRETLAALVLGSAECRGRTITSYYGSLLRRSTSPATAEVAGWSRSGLDLRRIREAFALSTEFFFSP